MFFEEMWQWTFVARERRLILNVINDPRISETGGNS